MKITMNNDVAYVETPYNPAFVKKVRRIGGARWNAAKRAWQVPASTVEEVRKLMRQVYGEDDSGCETVTVKLVTTGEVHSNVRAPILLYGRVIADATSRDGGCRVGTGVSIVCPGDTDVRSSGSVKNYYAVVPEGAEITVHNVPKQLVESELPDGFQRVSISAEQTRKELLLRERERLLAQVSKIDAELEGIEAEDN